MELRRGEAARRPFASAHSFLWRSYVPSELLQLCRPAGPRQKSAQSTRHPGVEIDILPRNTSCCSAGFKGLDAVDTAEKIRAGRPGRRRNFSPASPAWSRTSCWQKGFRVVDMNRRTSSWRPQPDKTLLRDHNDQFTLTRWWNYELLETDA